MFLTPPAQVPDEPNQFYRAYQISEGGLLSMKITQRVGGDLPKSLEQMVAGFIPIAWTSDRYTSEKLKTAAEIPLNPESRTFVDFNNTAMYSPLCYAPQSLAIFLLRIFACPPFYIFYAARLLTLLTWAFMIWLGIRRIPVFKWLMVLLALLPMSLFMGMSINADVMTNATGFLFIATVLQHTFDKRHMSSRQLYELLVLVLLLVSMKSVYVPLLLLLFLIPRTKFGSSSQYYGRIALLLGSGIIVSLLWSKVLNGFYLSYADYNPFYRDKAALVNGVNMHEQIAYIKDNGFYIFGVFFSTLYMSFDMYFPGFIGTFGWLDLHLPAWMVYAAYGLILLVAFSDGAYEVRIRNRQRWVFSACVVSGFVLILLSQHLIWDYIGAPYVPNVQGRYLIPLAPLLFMLFPPAVKLRSSVLAFLVIASCTLLLGYCCMLFYGRYFPI